MLIKKLKLKKEEHKTYNEPKNKQNYIVTLIIIILILLLLLIGFKIVYIEKNSFESWEMDQIEITRENLQILNNTKLNIFGRQKNGEKKVIAPMSSGSYRFSVKNKTDFDIIYNIKFEDDMSEFINMKYRLKIDNMYIKGDSSKYIDIDELDVFDIIAPKGSENIYTLEWYWESDDENDTKIGILKDNQYYYFKMQISSNVYQKKGAEQ